MKTLYVRTTTDEYEFPIYVADNVRALARKLGVKESTVRWNIKIKRKGWYKIEVGE